MYDQTKFHIVKFTDNAFDHTNAFDHMELCFVLEELFQLKIGLFFQEITFITEFPGSHFFGT